jgi:riboflavin biosynthesis pyrimidine reductase
MAQYLSRKTGSEDHLTPLQLLHERPGLPAFALPAALRALYGGEVGFAAPCLFANFVASVDGVVALPDQRESGQIVSGNSEADRFVMALLRACAGAVLIGAGTFRKASGDLWRAEAIYPDLAAEFSQLRAARGLRPAPPLVIVCGSGRIDTPLAPALADAVIATTPAGEARLRGRVPARLLVFDAPVVPLAALIQRLHEDGLTTLLTEGGPSLVAEFVTAGLLDELFLTRSPLLFGRYPNDGRKPLLEGAELATTPLELLSARLHDSHLFLRYSTRWPERATL